VPRCDRDITGGNGTTRDTVCIGGHICRGADGRGRVWGTCGRHGTTGCGHDITGKNGTTRVTVRTGGRVCGGADGRGRTQGVLDRHGVGQASTSTQPTPLLPLGSFQRRCHRRRSWRRLGSMRSHLSLWSGWAVTCTRGEDHRSDGLIDRTQR
jgi:hypothetical protein